MRARNSTPRSGSSPTAPAAHVGLGILRENERSMNRAKVEFLAALRADENNVLAREYLGRSIKPICAIRSARWRT